MRTRKHCVLPFIANFYSKPGQPQVQISFLFILSVHSQFTLSFFRSILTVFEVKSIFSTNFRSFPDFCFGSESHRHVRYGVYDAVLSFAGGDG